MGKPVKYANLDCFTKSYPGPRGGSICFRPGEAREGHWWSRFVGKEGLKEVPPDYNPTRDFNGFSPVLAMPVVSPRVVAEARRVSTGCQGRCDSNCQVSCEGNCQLACENSKQLIQVTDNYEKVGADYYCRHCDWSTQDLKRVEEHMAAYHPECVRESPEEAADSESWSRSQDAVDPGEETHSSPEARAVPAQGSPPPETPKKKSKKKPKKQKEPPVIKENEYWELCDGLYHCLSCRKNAGVKWSTASRPAMIRHAKRYHHYEDEKDKFKKKIEAAGE